MITSTSLMILNNNDDKNGDEVNDDYGDQLSLFILIKAIMIIRKSDYDDDNYEGKNVYIQSIRIGVKKR